MNLFEIEQYINALESDSKYFFSISEKQKSSAFVCVMLVLQ